MKLALYKGRKRLFNRVVSLWTQGIYSHCEIVFSDGMCGSSSHMDGGVRVKYIELDPQNWDIVDLPGDEAAARQWFAEHNGLGYDYLGLLGFVIRPIRGLHGRWLCSEAVMDALGYEDSWRFCPNTLAAVYKK